jgi:hypothetical protein
LALDILYNLEQECLSIPESKISFEFNLGIIKANIESDIKPKSPATLATQLVGGISKAVGTLKKFHFFDALNIMLDEVDQISDDINFGHFMKIVHEALNNKRLPVTFILAGQQGVFTRFTREDASFERIVRHIPLSILDPDAANYILDFAAQNTRPRFSYDIKMQLIWKWIMKQGWKTVMFWQESTIFYIPISVKNILVI